MVKWTTVLRPGYSGFQKEKLKKEWDTKFGKGWRVIWEIEGKFIERAQVFSICEQSYFADSFKREQLWKKLCKKARNVYDMKPDEVGCGLDYSKQTGPTHFHDITIRRVLKRRGWKFQGKELVQIRMSDSKTWSELDPGKLPFHLQELIKNPHLKGWWDPNSVEDFYQSNKVLQIKK